MSEDANKLSSADTGLCNHDKQEEGLSYVDDVPFSVLTKLYSDLRKVRTGSKRRRDGSADHKGDTRYGVLTRVWLQLSEYVPSVKHKMAAQSSDGLVIPGHLIPPSDTFKIVSLIIPELDSTHAYLGMKEVKLADAFTRALDLPSDSENAQWLKRYKERAYRPLKWRQDASIIDGDFPSVLGAVLKGRCPTNSSLTIGKVWHILDMLSQSTRVQNRRIVNAAHSTDAHTPSTPGGFESSKRRRADLLDDKKHGALALLVQHGTSDEVSEVARIILKDMNMRLSLDNFLNWFHPAAKQHYTQIHDVHRMLADCYDPDFDIGDASVQLGRYASVMLTMRPSRKDLHTICEKLRGHGPSLSNAAGSSDDIQPYFIMEPKLDGERMQLHKWQKDGSVDTMELKTFTRRGNDSSAMYADALLDVVKTGVRARDVILDGEIMIWDDLRGTWLRFENMREVTTAIARRSVPEGSSYTLKYMVFDVLYIEQGLKSEKDTRKGGNMVMRFPLRQRRRLLERIIRRTEARYGVGTKVVIEVVGMERGHDETELTNTLQRYEALGYEGVIAKNPDMPYILAERNLDVSIKLKPDYFDGGIQDVDVLILGAKYSSSRGHRTQRAGKLSSFLIGVRASDPTGGAPWGTDVLQREESMKEIKWIVIGSVGTGYSDKDLEQIQSQLDTEWRDFDAKNLPEHFESRTYPPAVLAGVAKWIQPWKSIALTVRAFEVNRRINVLRFPRVERVNWEKPYYDVTTLSHLLDLDENKLPAFIRADENDDDEVGTGPQGKKRRTGFDSDEELALQQVREEGHQVRGGRAARTVIASAVGADVSKVERLSEVFNGMTFHVSGSDVEAKEQVEVQIHELGGSFVQNVTTNVDYVICLNRQENRVRRLKETVRGRRANPLSGRFSIIESGWVKDCRHKLSKTTPSKTHVVFANRDLEAELYKDCDRFGDWWRKETNMKSFECSVAEAVKWEKENKGYECDEELSGTIRKAVACDIVQCERDSGLIFKGMAVSEAKGELKLPGSVSLLRTFGADILAQLDKKSTHVLVHSTVVSKWKDSSEAKLCKSAGHQPMIITEQWVRHSIDEGRALDSSE